MTFAIQLPPELRSAIDGRMAVAVELARLSGDSTLDLFGSGVTVERKADDSPVTEADKRAERLLREELAKRFPEDAILGEEFGEESGDSPYQWIVDPIDGTKSYISGVPLYSTLVGLVHRGECVAGVIYLPALREIVFAGRGLGAWHATASSPDITQCQVSNRPLSEGLFVVSQVDTFAARDAADAYLRVEKEAYITRSWGDGYGYLLVATGRAELMVDPIANAWDLAAVQPVVEEAGGRFTDWQGNPTVFGGEGVGSNGLVHDTALRLLA
jgi:histidinol-phosphatase